ncbi:hypothetical protein MMS87_28305 [Escherichia coli]|nr:hypothetical protein [Escherichia coli]
MTLAPKSRNRVQL